MFRDIIHNAAIRVRINGHVRGDGNLATRSGGDRRGGGNGLRWRSNNWVNSMKKNVFDSLKTLFQYLDSCHQRVDHVIQVGSGACVGHGRRRIREMEVRDKGREVERTISAWTNDRTSNRSNWRIVDDMSVEEDEKFVRNGIGRPRREWRNGHSTASDKALRNKMRCF
jgi:hypothetical protein